MKEKLPIPNNTALVMLASLVIHVQEANSDGGHKFDVQAAITATENPDVQIWLMKMPKVLLPRKR